jgi:hypothetical protein
VSPTILLQHLHMWCSLIDDQLIGPFILEVTFNSRQLPAFPTGKATISFGRHSSPGQMKYVAATQWRSTSFHSTSHTALESVLWELLDWSWRSACLATPSPEITGTRWNHMANYGLCCSHAEQSQKCTESNTRYLKMSSVVHSQCRRAFQTASHVSMLYHNIH